MDNIKITGNYISVDYPHSESILLFIDEVQDDRG